MLSSVTCTAALGGGREPGRADVLGRLVMARRRPREASGPLDCVLPGPLPSCGLVPRAVRLVYVGNLRDKRVVRVGVRQHRADGEENYEKTKKSVKLDHHMPKEYNSIPLEIVNAGLHWSRRMSRQMLPLELMLGW